MRVSAVVCSGKRCMSLNHETRASTPTCPVRGPTPEGFIESPDGKFKIVVAVLAHIKGSSAIGAEAPLNNGR